MCKQPRPAPDPKAIWFSLLVTLLLSPMARAQEGSIRLVHDPVIIRNGATFYVFCSGAGVPIRSSPDLYHWQEAGRVFAEAVPAWAKKEIPGASHVWAPDISFFNNRFHLYYSVSTLGNRRSVIGLATSPTLNPASPEYKWTDHGKVLETFPEKNDFNAIDPNLVLDEDEQPWLVFGSFWTAIKATPLAYETGMRSLTNHTIYSLAANPPSTAIEGAFMVRKNGFYYLFASVDHCCRGVASNYKVIVGRSTKVTGPFLDFRGRPMLEGGATLVLASHEFCRGPGHNGILLDRTGDWMVHHYYDARENGAATMQVRPLLWGSDGWPVVGEPIQPGQTAQYQDPANPALGIWRHAVNFRADEYFELRPGGKMNAVVIGASWLLKGPMLNLCWPDTEAPSGAWVDTCFVAADGKSYTGRNQRGDVVRGVKN